MQHPPPDLLRFEREKQHRQLDALWRRQIVGESGRLREVQAVIDLAIARKQPGLARAVELGRWGGFRKQTICAMPVGARIERPTHKGEETRLKWVTQKRKVLCDRREDPRLSRLIEATPSRSIHIAYNAYGEPWKPRSLSQALDRVIEDLAKMDDEERPGAKKVRPDLTIHGLRHSWGGELAHKGGERRGHLGST